MKIVIPNVIICPALKAWKIGNSKTNKKKLLMYSVYP